MARPRVATDEEIIAAAEEMAAEAGWRAIRGNNVRLKMDLGGSATTFIKVINEWRKEKEAEELESTQEVTTSEIVDDRGSAVDEGLLLLHEAAKKIRDDATREIDRAVSDERRKGDSIRSEERVSHEALVAELRVDIEALEGEGQVLTTETEVEIARADAAEEDLEQKALQITDLASKVKSLTSEADKVPGLVREVASLEEAASAARKKAETDVAKLEGRITKTEDREAKARQEISEKEEVIVELRSDLKAVNADLSTARSDVTTARSERAASDRALEAAKLKIGESKHRQDDTEKMVELERRRADEAWAQIQAMQTQIDELLKRQDAIATAPTAQPDKQGASARG